MGATYSFLQAEQKTWIEHTLVYDKDCREHNLSLLDKFEDGQPIYMSSVDRTWGGIKFEHWFVTTGTMCLEFGSPTLSIYTARVNINPTVYAHYSVGSRSTIDEAMRNRIRHVLGMSNYSLCLRNCEHVANYVFRGRWISSQMNDQGFLMKQFRHHMLGDQIRLVNTFPALIRPHVFGNAVAEPMYSFITDHYKANRFDYYLDAAEDTYNVLVVGPTGSGKSHLINVFFNQKICDSEVSHRSVTKEIYFIRGRGTVYSLERKAYEQREVVVADTIGLCDTEWDDKKVLELIRGRVSSNFKYIDAVFVVFRADRLLKEHVSNIKHLLKWLKYGKSGRNYLKFQFVGTYSDYLNDNEKEILRKEATDIFSLNETSRCLMANGKRFQSLIYTGFPPEVALNDMTKAKVNECWENLQDLLRNPGNTARLSVQEGCTLL